MLFLLLAAVLTVPAGASLGFVETSDGSVYCFMYNSLFAELPTSPPLSFSPLVPADPETACVDVPTISNDGVSLVMRGACSFANKSMNVERAGASAIIIRNNSPNIATMTIPGPTNATYDYDAINIPVGMVSKSDGDALASKEPSIGVRLYTTALSTSTHPFNAAFIALVILAVLTVFMGSTTPCHTSTDDANSNNNEEESDNMHLTWKSAVSLLLMSSTTLLLLYFFFAYLVYLFIVLFVLLSCLSVYLLLSPLIPSKKFFQIVLFLLSAVLPVTWAVFRHSSFAWALQDLCGFAVIVTLIRSINLPNFKICTIGLCLFFVYDIFFVFVTPLLTKSHTSVMEHVAIHRGSSGEELPLTYKMPLFNDPFRVCDLSYSQLGFGDMAIPGLLVGLCARIDRHLKMNGTLAQSTSQYQLIALIFYTLSLFCAYLGVTLMEKAQPALMYIVPLMLCSVGSYALFRHEFALLWHFDRIKRIKKDDSESPTNLNDVIGMNELNSQRTESLRPAQVEDDFEEEDESDSRALL